ncbi:MAG: tRNA (guanosine(46)-N7)-methyltransferase TrmB [bacterium]|nr:tRNA (guanosine(46)-N7)-methyltransferase TrmB [bacterium]
MPRKKLQRFAELRNFNNVAENNQAQAKLKLRKFLAKNKDIILELACGKGEYALALAQKYQRKKIIGIDIQGERLWFGAKFAQENKINNVFFLREQIENLENYFTKNSISQIWITFPDPRPRKSQIKKRLTNPRFLKIYQNILKNKSTIHLKTDDDNFFAYSQQSVLDFSGKINEQITNLYKSRQIDETLKVQTYYEKTHLKKGKIIHYLEFSLK